jgi:hypothetical protein
VYRWDGNALALVEEGYLIAPPAETLAYCRLAVDHAAAVWGPQAAASMVEALLPLWPPERDENGRLMPLDARDEMRFRLGVYYALSGDRPAAVQALQDLSTNPTLPASRWSAPARRFLEAYPAPAGVYRACVTTELCYPEFAVHLLLAELETSDSRTALESLRQAGLALRASGLYDFDRDGQEERWFTLQYRPAEKIELWILASGQDRLHGLQVGTVESGQPTFSQPYNQPAPPVIWADAVQAFVLRSDPGSGLPYLERFAPRYVWPDHFDLALAPLREALLEGGEPRLVQNALINLERNPGLVCQGDWSCDEYYYLLGLAAELNGQPRFAVEQYLYLWWNYRSPYTTLARLKLASLVTPTPFTPGTPPAAPTLTPTPGTAYPLPATATPNTPYP